MHAKGEIELISNVRRHRQAAMPGGTRQSAVRRGTCRRQHRSFRCTAGPTVPARGELLARPAFQPRPRLNSQQLPSARGTDCCSRTTAATSRLIWLVLREQLQFDGFCARPCSRCTRQRQLEDLLSRSIWRTITSAPSHPVLGNFVTCDDLKWEFASEYLGADWVGVAPGFGNPGSDIYKEVARGAAGLHRNGELPDRGAIWLTYYPHIMVESAIC